MHLIKPESAPAGAPADLQAVIGPLMNLEIEYDEEDDGRVMAEIEARPGCLAYGSTRAEASRRIRALALRVMADKIEHGELVA